MKDNKTYTAKDTEVYLNGIKLEGIVDPSINYDKNHDEDHAAHKKKIACSVYQNVSDNSLQHKEIMNIKNDLIFALEQLMFEERSQDLDKINELQKKYGVY